MGYTEMNKTWPCIARVFCVLEGQLWKNYKGQVRDAKEWMRA
jgi:hypothetical protein